ncbi:taste receptor type 2 member 46-like [Sorex fumeus]|uniref:taste receptor type 2 member 46-like n=1 Tax=Sorex fumeus TaxID=62283 RepID=UPI0024ACB112|nr:taste receptor type 2 member 46-like [Sorex fumeus]
MALLLWLLSILGAAIFILGNFANGFIVLVKCIDWRKRWKFSLVDQILTALAVSRIGLLWVILINWQAIVLNSDLFNLKVRMVSHFAWILTNHFSNWLTTSLGVFYLLKIANFSSLPFLYLKWRIRHVLLGIILGSLPFLMFHFAMGSIYETVQINFERNTTLSTKLIHVVHISNMTAETLVNVIPFTMSLTSLVLLVFSLWKHLKKQQLNDEGSQDPSIKVHIRAIQTVISFLVLFIIFFLSLVISVWSSMGVEKKVIVLFCMVLGTLYPSVHSFILIWGNKKLKQTFVALWHIFD